jgi:short-subunit dehydrogenase
MKIAILGASRGLGKELVLEIQKTIPDAKLLLISRKFDLLKSLARDGKDVILSANFATREGRKATLLTLKDFLPDALFYVAGGGPYGKYGEKDWKDHEWAFDVNFRFPARVLHWATKHKPENLKNVVMVGSSVAENNPDPHAASYAAGKHALKGLVDTLNLEGTNFDLKLFSPGYMATDMLPKNSTPRLEAKAADPRDVAKSLLKISNLM